MKNISLNNFFLARLVHPPNTLLDFPPPPADQVMMSDDYVMIMIRWMLIKENKRAGQCHAGHAGHDDKN